MIWLKVKDKLVSELSKNFDPKVKFEERLKVLSDLAIFRPKEDISVWRQKQGQLPEYFTVYFDDEYICGFDDRTSLDKAVLEFWKGFKEAYTNKKIRLSKKEIVVEKPKKEKIKATTKDEKMAVEIVERLNKKTK